MVLQIGPKILARIDRLTTVRCGVKGCAAPVGKLVALYGDEVEFAFFPRRLPNGTPVMSITPKVRRGSSHPSESTLPYHVVWFFPGIADDSSGVWRLTPRVQRQWELAKRQRITWQAFIWSALGRRRGKGGTLPPRQRSVDLSEEGIRFICPVCGRLNTLAVNPSCNEDCPYH